MRELVLAKAELRDDVTVFVILLDQFVAQRHGQVLSIRQDDLALES